MLANSYDPLCLTPAFSIRPIKDQTVYSTPDVEAKLKALAMATGRAADAIVQDAMAGYFEGLAKVRVHTRQPRRRYQERPGQDHGRRSLL
jgi:hypothetical protein